MNVMQSIVDLVDLASERLFIENKIDQPQVLLRQIKDRFVDRDYVGVFQESKEQLAVYMAHYTPSRAMCYYSLVSDSKLLGDILSGRRQKLDYELQRRKLARKGLDASQLKLPDLDLNVTCIGAGSGSELVAFYSYISQQMHIPNESIENPESVIFSEYEDSLTGFHLESARINLIDFADWSQCYQQLASELSVLSNDTRLSSSFTQRDILSMDDKTRKMLSQSQLITFMFVLNELFAESRKSTAIMLVDFFQNLVQDGTYILVLESAGSFSELQIKEGKSPTMVFQLLDKIRGLKVLESHDSKWFRHPAKIQSKFPLDNMRYFYRLYQFNRSSF
ncbi:hypothetical protein MP228_001465 [Amoeboaphelidium protococcarum]|nr:hypothetical protein MP228_001465 [Amoeboaphelidium protococcarum]